MPTDHPQKIGVYFDADTQRLMTIQERSAQLMEEEERNHPEKTWWYLSYAGPGSWRGGAIIEAHGFIGACDYARTHYIQPWPDVETQGIPIPPHEVPPEEYRNRLLTRAEIESFWGAMKTFREYEEDKNAN